MPFHESYEEFCDRHGRDQIQIDGWLVFSDGARCDAQRAAIKHEPPADPIMLLKMKRRYVAEKERRAEEDFKRMQNAILQQLGYARNNPDLPAPTNGPEVLARLSAEYLKWRDLGLALDAQLPDNAQARRERAQAEWERQAKVDALTQEVAGISLE